MKYKEITIPLNLRIKIKGKEYGKYHIGELIVKSIKLLAPFAIFKAGFMLIFMGFKEFFHLNKG